VIDLPAVPVIDLSFATGSDLVAGLQQASCVFLTGLDSLSAQAASMVAVSDAFFALSEAEKGRVRWSGQGPWVGWQPLYAGGDDALLLERFEIALPDPEDFATAEEWTNNFDQWPDRPLEMAPVWGAYYRSMRALADRITAMLVAALDLPPDDLPSWTTRQHSNLVVNHYLPQVTPPAPGRVRQKPHTDHGGLTLLWADGRAGLEAAIGADGAWVPVSFPPGAILLQAGDLLHLWSRGTIPANNHRVVNPPRESADAQAERYSVVFFHHPDLDTWVAPPGDATFGVKARDYVLQRQKISYSLD